MDSVLHGLPFASTYLDDILVSSPNVESHKDHLHQVFLHLQKAGLTLCGRKYYIGVPEVRYLGHIFSATGIQQTPNKVQYSSKATWYLHACCSLKFLVWRLHHARSVFERVLVMFTIASGKSPEMYPRTFHSFWINFLMKLNINCICTMNLQTLSLYVPIDPWVESPTEKPLMCSCVQYLIPYCLVCYRLVWKMYYLLAIESPLTSSCLARQLVGSQ